MVKEIEIPPENIVTLCDGYKYYWPVGFPDGAFSAHTLREIAKELDKQNEAWDNQVEEYFKDANSRQG